MQRREFNKLCGGLLAGAASLSARDAVAQTQPYTSSALVYDDDSPVTVDSLAPGVSCVFSYPYVTTPCFVVRLRESAIAKDGWQGGVGDDRSVVAFSAICSHKMSHPAKPISHINFRDEKISFFNDGKKIEQSQVISCCSERSVYDPANAGAVLSGPAPVPLASIALELSDDGQIIAVGSVGPNQYERFLDMFGFRLAMEYGVSDVRARVGEKTLATLAERFSSQQIRC